jgi:replicative DNA helicase
MSAEAVAFGDFDPERAVIGALLLDETVLASVEAQLRVEHFQVSEHRTIYAAILTMAHGSRSIDLVTVKSELAASGELEAAGGTAYLASLTDGLPRMTNVSGWVRIVREKARRRAAISIAHRLIEQADSPEIQTDDLVERAQAGLARLQQGSEKRIVSLRDVLPRAIQELETFATAKEGVTGIPTGLIDLDRCIGGLHGGRLYIVAARTSRGKSVLCAQIAINAAVHGTNVLVFSMEMEPYQLATRMILADAEVDKWDLKPESPKADYSWGKVNRSTGRLAELPVWFDQSESPNLSQIRASVRQQANGPGVGLVVVDYLQRCHVDPKVDRWLSVGDLTKGLKSMALSVRVPVVAACQLNSEGEEKRPTLAMLAQAQSVISAEADAVVMIHPDDLAKWKTQNFPLVHFFVDKNRSGPCLDVRVSFEKSVSRFVSLSGVHDADASR